MAAPKINCEDVVRTLYTQPEHSNYCGVFTVAHLANILPEEAEIAFLCTGMTKRQLKRGTTVKEVSAAIIFLGYKTPGRLHLMQPGERLPNRCILNIRWYNPGTEQHGKGHWVLYNGGWVACSGPDRSGIWKYDEYLKDRIGVNVSYLLADKS